MKLSGQAELLRIFIGESDKYQGRPLHEVIVEEARRRGNLNPTISLCPTRLEHYFSKLEFVSHFVFRISYLPRPFTIDETTK